MIIENERDLSSPQLEFLVFKKSREFEIAYHVHVCEKFVYIGKSVDHIKYELPIELSTHIKWDMEDYTDE